MSNTGDSELRQKALKIAARHSREKLTYRIKCKAKYEFKRVLRGSRFHRPASASNFNLSAVESPKNTYSESLQDRFVIEMTTGSALRHYLEIGSGPPIIKNNTYLLESKFGWGGLSLDFNPNFVREFQFTRRNPVVHADATNFDYFHTLEKLGFPEDIGYLQIDIDPSYQSLITLFQIPFHKFRFATITFEHDLYRSNSKVAKISRQKLQAEGYRLVVMNVLAAKGKPFEDWWVHPDLVSHERYQGLISNRINPSRLFDR